MYCSEQIVIPEKVSNLLKTYAKGMSGGKKFQPFNVFNIHLHYAWNEISPLSAIYTAVSEQQQQQQKIKRVHKTKSAAAQRHTHEKKNLAGFIVGELFIIFPLPLARRRLCENLHTLALKGNLQARWKRETIKCLFEQSWTKKKKKNEACVCEAWKASSAYAKD